MPAPDPKTAKRREEMIERIKKWIDVTVKIPTPTEIVKLFKIHRRTIDTKDAVAINERLRRQRSKSAKPEPKAVVATPTPVVQRQEPVRYSVPHGE